MTPQTSLHHLRSFRPSTTSTHVCPLPCRPRRRSGFVIMAEPTATAAPHTKQYVFVDEYNRHKRLKVMRACDGCRKRKIRCDGALQNGPWPCGACVRLKLKCVPPTLDPDDDPITQAAEGSAGNTQFTFQNTTFNPNTSKSSQHTSSPAPTDYSWTNSTRSPLSTAPTSAP